jgi:hypothetical protein
MTSGKAFYIMDGKDVAIALAVMTNQLSGLSMLRTVCVQVGFRFLVNGLLLKTLKLFLTVVTLAARNANEAMGGAWSSGSLEY